MSRIIDIALIGLAGGALIAGAYHAGKLSERSWWRHELASRNQEVKATIAKLGREADDLDATLLRIIEGDRAKLEDAEAQIAAINKRPAAQPELDGLCRPVSAQCLQRRGTDDRPQTAGAAARRP